MVMEEEEMIGLKNGGGAAAAALGSTTGGSPVVRRRGFWVHMSAPSKWVKMLARETHWSFVAGVVVVYGISQGLGGGLGRVAIDYYWKDVQKVQPSEAQVYQGITSIPWVIKPIWGLLTDVIPIAGYRRRPYFVFAGLIGAISVLVLFLHKNLLVEFALMCLTAASAGIAIADVTIDACVAQNSSIRPALAADMQSLCGFSSSVGRLIGFSLSGLLVHFIGSQGVIGLLGIPAMLVFLVGVLLDEQRILDFNYRHVSEKMLGASRSMWITLKYPAVWRPSLYMYLSLALSVNIHEGLFYWLTDSKDGPGFSQENVGFIFSIGAIGSLLGVLLYQNILKDHPFRDLLFWSQLLHAIGGMLDLILVLRLNLKLGIPDYFFVVIDESVSQMIGRIKWMPLLVLSAKLCPPGIEGTFFALLMSIDNVGLLSSSWLGGLLLHIVKVTRTEFANLWVAVLVRNIIRILPLFFLFLVPKSDQYSTLLPADLLRQREDVRDVDKDETIEMAALMDDKNDN